RECSGRLTCKATGFSAPPSTRASRSGGRVGIQSRSCGRTRGADPAMHIGKADPWKALADERGLTLRMQFDLDDPTGAKVFKLVKEKRVREWSFAYDVIAERPAKDGANELMELDLIEAGPTLKGANP